MTKGPNMSELAIFTRQTDILGGMALVVALDRMSKMSEKDVIAQGVGTKVWERANKFMEEWRKG